MTDWLKTLAPLLGTAIAGPFGGVAASFLAEKLGIESKTVEAVTAALSDSKMSAEQVASVRLAEIDFKKWMGDNEIKKEQLGFEDRKSAREMQMATHSRMPAVLTTLVTIGFFGILILLIYKPEFKANEIILIMVGQLSVAWAGCIAFYTGTTYGSANKNAMLANSAPAK
jgi:hypothetical protein